MTGPFCMRRIYVALLALLLCHPLTTGAVSNYPPKMFSLTPGTYVPYTLSISGGVSLGSYEAGLNWALLRYLRLRRNDADTGNNTRLPPELLSISGASAGSINALLSAMMWCAQDTLDSAQIPANSAAALYDGIDNNLFRDIWINVGIDSLLPPDEVEKGQGYLDDDGLFTRRAFEVAIQRIIHLLNQPLYRQDCNIPIGVTLTKVQAHTMSVAGVKVDNQRFMMPFRLAYNQETHDGKIRILSHIMNPLDPYLGNVLYMQGENLNSEGSLHQITPEQIIEALQTSSAFPIAFGRKYLHYCQASETPDNLVTSATCPRGYTPASSQFLDGGVFDNVPLGVAKTLAEPSPLDVSTKHVWQKSALPYNYIYVDPDNRRGEQPAQDNNPYDGAPQSFGLRTQLKFFGGAITTGRNYELYNVLRSGDWSKQSFYNACHLAKRLRGDVNPDSPCNVTEQVPQQTCNYLFNLIKSSPQLGQPRKDELANCILKKSNALEEIYSGLVKPIYKSRIESERSDLLHILGNTATTIGDLQLALTLRNSSNDLHNDRRLLLSTRYDAITGSMLQNFGAFIDKPFRQYDYYSGAYDAIHGIANFLCERRQHYDACMSGRVQDIFTRLNVSESVDAQTIFYLLATREHPDFDKADKPWHWLTTLEAASRSRNQNLVRIFDALHTHPPASYTEGTELSFDDFIRELFARGYDINESSPFMRRIYRLRDRDSSTWYYPLTSRISRRLLELERNEQAVIKGGEVIRGSLGLAALAAHSYFQEENTHITPRSAAPEYSWETLLPYELGVDLRNGGPMVAWQPSLTFGPSWALDSRVTPLFLNRYANNDILFAQYDLFLSYRRNGLISSMGIGPTLTYTWSDWPGHPRTALGSSIYLGFMQDKLRLSAGTRGGSEVDFPGNSVYLSLSITDIPGMVYWLRR